MASSDTGDEILVRVVLRLANMYGFTASVPTWPRISV